MKVTLQQGSQKIDALYHALQGIEKLHAETSDGFSDTLVKAYTRILDQSDQEN